jgi:hypothetical protein
MAASKEEVLAFLRDKLPPADFALVMGHLCGSLDLAKVTQLGAEDGADLPQNAAERQGMDRARFDETFPDLVNVRAI